MARRKKSMEQVVSECERCERLATDVIKNMEDALRLIDSETGWLLASIAMMKITAVEAWLIADIQRCLEDDKKRKCA